MVGSLGVVVYLMARALPRVTDTDEQPNIHEHLGLLMERLPLHHVDERLNAFLYKFLRQVRVIMMKIDNRLMRALKRVKQHGESTGAPSPVQELFDEVKNEKKE